MRTMTSRRLTLSRLLAWSAFSVSLLLSLTAVALLALGRSAPLDVGWGFRGFEIVLAFAFSSVGVVVTVNRPANRIGWVFLTVGLVSAYSAMGSEYAHYSLLSLDRPLLGAIVFAWSVNWAWVPQMALLWVGLLMLFPDGRFQSDRWRYLGYASLVVLAALTVVLALEPGPLQSSAPYIISPYSVEVFAHATERLTFLVVYVAAVAAASQVSRYRNATTDIRQQMKWLVSISVVVSLFLALNITGLAVFEYLAIAAIAAIPVAAGVAILRHRLFDIDVIINRSLVYAALTATLGAVYFVNVVLLQLLFRAATGQNSNLALVISTLGIAAIFQPVRRRVQETIDRRLYRSKYDAALTLAAFSTMARDEVDIMRLSEALLAVTLQTMQPAHSSLWLRTLEPVDATSDGATTSA